MVGDGLRREAETASRSWSSDIAAASRSRISRLRAVSLREMGSAAGAEWRRSAAPAARRLGPKMRLARGDGPDRPADLLLLGACHHVAAGTGAHGGEHRVVIVEHGQDQDGDLGC